MDNRGNRLLVSDIDSAINLPAVGAAYAIKKYSAQAPDELCLEVCLSCHIVLRFVLVAFSLIKITANTFCKCFLNLLFCILYFGRAYVWG